MLNYDRIFGNIAQSAIIKKSSGDGEHPLSYENEMVSTARGA